MAPTYRERLRAEGLTLAAAGAAGSAVIFARAPGWKRWPLNTVGQLALTAALVTTLGPRSARKTMAEAELLEPGAEGDGNPTPLWHVPIPMLALTAFVGIRWPVTRDLGRRKGEPVQGWDAGLRATAGSLLFGLGQAFILERVVASAERLEGRRYYRLPGSSLKGTRLGYVPAEQ